MALTATTTITIGAAAPSWDLGSSWTADLPHELACSSWTADLCSAADGDQGQYVDLVDNPEQYTGYSSDAGASRVWEEWHAHNSFLPADDGSCASAAGAAAPAALSRMPVEMRLFHRLTSGIHASVSSHIAANYLLDRKSNTWGLELDEYVPRLADSGARPHDGAAPPPLASLKASGSPQQPEAEPGQPRRPDSPSEAGG